jgi:hypothetical protein
MLLRKVLDVLFKDDSKQGSKNSKVLLLLFRKADNIKELSLELFKGGVEL